MKSLLGQHSAVKNPVLSDKNLDLSDSKVPNQKTVLSVSNVPNLLFYLLFEVIPLETKFEITVAIS